MRDVLKTIVASAARSCSTPSTRRSGCPDDHGGFAQLVVDGVSDEQWKAIGPLPRQHGILAAMPREAKTERLADVRKRPPLRGLARPPTRTCPTLGLPIKDGDETIGALFPREQEAP